MPDLARRSSLLALTLAWALGCGSADDPAADAGPDAAPGDPDVLVGSFLVDLIAATDDDPGYTSVFGKIYDGPTPAPIIWEEALAEGDCQLFTPRVPFCATSCGGSALCVEDATCQPYPTAHSAGVVHVSGMTSDFDMEAIAGSYQPPAAVALPLPAFAEGDELTFAAAGDYFAPFTLGGRGVAPLELELGGDPITLAAGSPVELAWTAAGQAATSVVHVKLDISHHGGSKGMITCETADDGALTLPAAMIDELLDLGIAGFPTIIVTRSAVDSTIITQGRIDLSVSSRVEQAVDIPGLSSCLDDLDCPDDQTCQDDLTCL